MHDAFTWGGLDRLLEEDRVKSEGVSASFADAMNAAAVESAIVGGGRAGARENLNRF